jgi:flagellar export protein FliJ
MKRFDFPLERVREWREKQVAVEEAKLERLFAELSAIAAARAELDAEQARNEQLVVQAGGVTASDLQALDGFRRYVKAERGRIETLRADCSKRIEQQRAAILEARRRYELLGRLKQRSLRLWTAEMNRELEANAAEAYLAKWNAER